MLFELGAYRLLGNDPERTWRFSRVWVPWFLDWMTENVAYGMARIPAEGGVVLAINHLSAIDPPAVGIHSLRTIRYMTKVELLQTPIVGEFLRMTGTFAVRRGEGDRDSIRVARWLLANGHIVGVFAEGTRRPFGYPDATQPGAALLAMQEGVPLVPIGLDSFGWSLRNRRPTAVVCGEPLDLSPFPRNGAGYKEATGVIEAELIRLWKLAVHAVEDGMPERLRDGTERDAPLRRRDLLYPPTGPPWPTEPWAEGPLGPVYKAIT
jgi:1-acyl-sn-glycerol-3-phosphate acyltransferase